MTKIVLCLKVVLSQAETASDPSSMQGQGKTPIQSHPSNACHHLAAVSWRECAPNVTVYLRWRVRCMAMFEGFRFYTGNGCGPSHPPVVLMPSLLLASHSRPALAKSGDNLQDNVKARALLAGQSLAEALPGKPCISGDLGHTLRSTDVTLCLGDEGRISIFLLNTRFKTC